MTVKDLFDVMRTIKEVDFVARNAEGRLLCEFRIGKEVTRDKLSSGRVYDWSKGRIYLLTRKINVHGDETRNGVEIAWGYKNKSIPDSLLNAEIAHLLVDHHYHGGYTLTPDVILSEIEVEILKRYFEEHGNGEREG